MTKHDILAALHELVGHCGHCGERSCPGRDSHSTLPKMLSTDDVCRALKMAKRAAKNRRQCARDTAWISKAERGGDSGDSAEPAIRVRESARDTGATGDGDGLGPAAVPGNAGAQAGDRSQSSAIGSASPSNVSPKDGQHREPVDAVPGESPPAGEKGDEGAGAHNRDEGGYGRPGPGASVPDEFCDIDDLPDCLVGGVHQPHCRHAGKPVTKGGNP